MLRTITIVTATAILAFYYLTNMREPVRPVSGQPIVVTEDTAQHAGHDELLESAVRIVMLSRLDGQLVANPALGTVVMHNGQAALLTHNHWHSLHAETAVEAQITTLDGTPLTTISADMIAKTTIYADAGTLLFAAPQGLAGSLTPAPLADAVELPAEATVQIVYGHATVEGGTFDVIDATIERVTTHKGLPAYRLLSANGAVVQQGNSGGAISYNGEIVGNMWGTITLADDTPTANSLGAQLPQLQAPAAESGTPEINATAGGLR